jgi:hypothetical protein
MLNELKLSLYSSERRDRWWSVDKLIQDIAISINVPIFGSIYGSCSITGHQLGRCETIFQRGVFEPKKLYCAVDNFSFNLT